MTTTAHNMDDASACNIDVASRSLGGAVIWANDESFASREHLILPTAASFDPEAFGAKGKIYDGWETRRRRSIDPGDYDVAIIRLGVPAAVTQCIVDTSWFRGNYPPQCQIFGICLDTPLGAQEIAELPLTHWTALTPVVQLEGDCENPCDVVADTLPRCTHVRLHIIPDGGVARLRVLGVPAPDPHFLTGTVDLIAAEHGGWVRDCSNMFYSHPANIIGRGMSTSMADGWENARRRTGTCDYVTIALPAAGQPHWVEIDTSYFLHNSPEYVRLYGRDFSGQEHELLAAEVLPDCRNRFWLVPESELGEQTRKSASSGQHQVSNIGDRAITEIRLEVYPDGGISRLRLWGCYTAEGLKQLEQRWTGNPAKNAGSSHRR
ncbi:MAG: allantoicase [Corynebacterium sp.]|nr:allantoicase [Corynebacterium sp.]